MPNLRYQIVFTGGVIGNVSSQELRQRLGAALRMNARQVEDLYNNAPLVIRSNVNKQHALRFQQALCQLGAETHLEEMLGDDDTHGTRLWVKVSLVLVAVAIGYLAYLAQPARDSRQLGSEAGQLSATLPSAPNPNQPHYAAYKFSWENVNNSDWQTAIKRARNAPSVLNGSLGLSLLRVRPRSRTNELIQIHGTRLRQFDLSGAHRSFSVESGTFVIVEHAKNSQNTGRADKLVIGSNTLGSALIKVPTPAKGTVAVLGDLDLWLPPDVAMGGLQIQLVENEFLNDFEGTLHVAPIRTQDTDSISFSAKGVATFSTLAPGVYRMRMVDIANYADWWRVIVRPGKISHITLTPIDATRLRTQRRFLDP
jgi:hypothetical protein